MRRRRLRPTVRVASLLVFAAPASGASKNVELVDNLPEAKDATAINFMSTARPEPRRHARDRALRAEVVLAARSGPPELLDEVTAEELRLPGDPPVNFSPDARRSRRSGRTRTWTSTRAQARAAVARPARVRGLDVAASRASPTPTTRPTSRASTWSTRRTRATSRILASSSCRPATPRPASTTASGCGPAGPASTTTQTRRSSAGPSGGRSS